MGRSNIEWGVQFRGGAVDFFCAGWLLACVILFAELDAELGDHHDNPENRWTHGISIYLSLVEQAGTARHRRALLQPHLGAPYRDTSLTRTPPPQDPTVGSCPGS